jgi:hypothetical protein
LLNHIELTPRAAYGPMFWKLAAGDATPSFGAGVHAQMAAFQGVAITGSPFEALGQTLRIATYAASTIP